MLQSLDVLLGEGGSHVNDQLRQALQEIQGRTVSILAGNTAGTKLNVPALRLDDTLKSAIVLGVAGYGSPVDDVTHMSIVDTHAVGTLTVVGLPIEDSDFTVNAKVYTFKAEPSGVPVTGADSVNREIAIKSTIDAQTTAVANSINAWEGRHYGMWQTPAVVATAPVKATVLLTYEAIEGNATNLDQVVINSQTFVLKDTPSDATYDAQIGSNLQVSLENLVAKINADTALALVTAELILPLTSPTVAVVQLTANTPGTAGNSITTTATPIDDNLITVASTLSGGTGVAGVIQLRATADGVAGNSITLAADHATGSIAVSGAFLTGGIDNVYATGTVTVNSIGVNLDAVAIGGQTFTVATVPSGNNQIGIAASAVALTSALLAKILAHPSYASFTFTVTSPTTTTILATAKATGTSGNAVTLTRSGTTFTVTGAGTLTGGVTAVKASGTITLTVTPANGDSVTVNSVLYTFRDTPVAATDIQTNATNTVVATSLATTLNNATGLDAAAVGAIVTVTAATAGTAANAFTLAAHDTGAVSVSGTALAGGTATGGVTSVTNLSSTNVVLTWYNAAP